MKTTIKSIVLALLLGSVFTASATTPTKTESKFKISAYKIGAELKLKLNIIKTKDLKVKVEILNSKKEVVYSTNIAKNDTNPVFKFDLNDLQDGQYVLEISDGITTQTKEFNISTK